MLLHSNRVTCDQHAHVFKLQQTIAKYAQNRQVWRRKEKASFLNYGSILTNDCVSKPIKQWKYLSNLANINKTHSGKTLFNVGHSPTCTPSIYTFFKWIEEN